MVGGLKGRGAGRPFLVPCSQWEEPGHRERGHQMSRIASASRLADLADPFLLFVPKKINPIFFWGGKKFIKQST